MGRPSGTSPWRTTICMHTRTKTRKTDYSRSHAWINSSHHHDHHHISRKNFQARRKDSRAKSQYGRNLACSSGTPATTTPFPSTKKSLLSPVQCCAMLRVSARFSSSVLVTSGLLLLSELEVLAARDDELLLRLALLALQPKGHLLGGLGLSE